jgi:hypothetical protein
VIEQAKKLAERAETKNATDEAKIERLYRIAYQRAPLRDEVSLAKTFIREQPAITNRDEQKTAWQYGFGEYDAATKRVKNFSSLPHFTGSAWQGGAKLPDEKLGWVMLTADGGHVGDDLQHAAVRRWTAPADGTVKIRGQLEHSSKEGDGVHGQIVSSRVGSVGEWTIHNTNSVTKSDSVEVKRGDTIDFVVDMRGGYGFDSFTWAPRVVYTTPLASGAHSEWKAKEDFAGPQPKTQPLTRWQELAQVLLLSNEFMFVD